MEQRLLRVLDSDKLVLLVINQHCNVSHPKLLPLPHGLALDSYFDKKAVWDSMNLVLKSRTGELDGSGSGRNKSLVYRASTLSKPSESSITL